MLSALKKERGRSPKCRLGSCQPLRSPITLRVLWVGVGRDPTASQLSERTALITQLSPLLLWEAISDVYVLGYVTAEAVKSRVSSEGVHLL